MSNDELTNSLLKLAQVLEVVMDLAKGQRELALRHGFGDDTADQMGKYVYELLVARALRA